MEMYSVPLTTLVKEFKLEVDYRASDYEKIQLTVEDVARPGLQLAGYFDHFEPMRLQVMGNVEASYLQKLQPSERAITFDRLFSYKIPALLIARNLPLDPQCLEMAKKHNVTLLRSGEVTSTIVSAIIAYLKAALAPGSPGTVCWWRFTARVCCSLVTAASVKVRPLWSFSSGDTG